MKKLVILTQYFPPEMGAPQTRLFETAIGFKKRGWQVCVVTAMPNYPTGKIFDQYKGKLYATDTIEGIEVMRYTLYASNSKRSLPRIISMLSFSVSALFSLLSLRKFKPDYVLTESPPLTLAFSGLILARLCGAKHIMNVSDIWPLSAHELGAISKGFVYNRLEGLERFLYRNSFACTGQSGQIVSHLTQNGSRNSILFRNGVDTTRFEQLKIVTGPSSRKFRFVYAGLLGIVHGLHELCRNVNFAALGAEFHIYGEGAEKQEIADYLDKNPDRGIYLHPFVQRHEIPATIMQYDAVIAPVVKSIYGAVSSKIYEAMAAGLPIIFVGEGEGAAIIEENKTGWVCAPADYTAIADKIKDIATMERTKFEEIRSNCIYAARHVFNRDIQIERLNQFLLSEN